MSQSVIQSVTSLPDGGVTVAVLEALDSAVPGVWTNERSIKAMAEDTARQQLPTHVYKRVLQRAKELDAEHAGYRRALAVYQLTDRVDQLAAGTTIVGKVGGALGQLGEAIGGGLGGALKDLVPKPSHVQTIDAGLKLCAEVVAFGLVNGRDTSQAGALKRFAGAIEDYASFDLMRIAAWVVFEGLIPLGPGFLGQIVDGVSRAAGSQLTDNAVFSELSDGIPGDSVEDKRGFVVDAVQTAGDYVERLVAEKELTQEGALRSLRGVLSVAQSGGEYVAAAIDAATKYFSHTGTQTVGRALIRHALDDVKDEVWLRHLERAT